MGRESPWARGGLKWTHEGGIGGVVKADVSINRSVHWKWRIGEMENYTREIERKWDREKWETRWNIERICILGALRVSRSFIGGLREYHVLAVLIIQRWKNFKIIQRYFLYYSLLRNWGIVTFETPCLLTFFSFFFSFGISNISREFVLEIEIKKRSLLEIWYF